MKRKEITEEQLTALINKAVIGVCVNMAYQIRVEEGAQIVRKFVKEVKDNGFAITQGQRPKDKKTETPETG